MSPTRLTINFFTAVLLSFQSALVLLAAMTIIGCKKTESRATSTLHAYDAAEADEIRGYQVEMQKASGYNIILYTGYSSTDQQREAYRRFITIASQIKGKSFSTIFFESKNTLSQDGSTAYVNISQSGEDMRNFLNGISNVRPNNGEAWDEEVRMYKSWMEYYCGCQIILQSGYTSIEEKRIAYSSFMPLAAQMRQSGVQVIFFKEANGISADRRTIFLRAAQSTAQMAEYLKSL